MRLKRSIVVLMMPSLLWAAPGEAAPTADCSFPGSVVEMDVLGANEASAGTLEPGTVQGYELRQGLLPFLHLNFTTLSLAGPPMHDLDLMVCRRLGHQNPLRCDTGDPTSGGLDVCVWVERGDRGFVYSRGTIPAEGIDFAVSFAHVPLPG